MGSLDQAACDISAQLVTDVDSGADLS